MPRLSLHLLGPARVTLDDRPVSDFATDKARALLFYLAVEAGSAHRREALTGLLWPDQPEERARQSLRQALLNVRQALGGDEASDALLLATRDAMGLRPGADVWLDVAVFSEEMAACERHRHRRLASCRPCLERLRRAVALYRGDFLAQFHLADSDIFEEWAVLRREWLHRRAVEALSYLADYHERRGEWGAAREYATRQVQLEPWREEAHRQLMRLLALEGQRSAALAQYEACRRALHNELGVEPAAETSALFARIRAGDRPGTVVPPVSLPVAPTSFVGRAAELAELGDLLVDPDCRLVTLVGPGGIGKTRLALQVAADQLGAFAHGVYFVPLAAVDSAEQLVAALADAVQLALRDQDDPRQQLLRYLGGKEMLLVLDSVEHIPAAAAMLAEILRRAPGVVLIVTSRERLDLQEEWVFDLQGLDCPAEGSRELEGYSAAELFVQRARRVQRTFAPSPDEAALVAQICRLLEGNPLGLELAASAVASRSCREIASEVARGLDVLATMLSNVPERHRSVRASIDYSWGLLREAERTAFRRLAVFRGRFSREAVLQVTEATPAVLSVLVRKSLLRHDPAGGFDLHVLLRQYAGERLAALPEEEKATRLRHTRHYADLMERASERLRGADWKGALASISAEIEEARQAWQVSLQRGWDREAEQILPALYLFYRVCGRCQEGADLLGLAVERWSGLPAQAGALARVLSRQGTLRYYQRLLPQARRALERSLAILDPAGPPGELIFALVNLAQVARGEGRYEEACRLAERGLELSRQAGDAWGIGSALLLLSMVRHHAGVVEQSEAFLVEGLSVARSSGDPFLLMGTLNALGDLACHRGEYARGEALFAECLALSREMGHLYNVALHCNNLGTALHSVGRYDEARAAYLESLQICRQVNDPSGQAVALSNLGEVASALGQHERARRYYEEGLAIARDNQDVWSTMACLNNLGEAAGALGDWPTARRALAEAVWMAREAQEMTVLMKALVSAAGLLIREGHVPLAAELIALAAGDPASEQDLRDKAARLAAAVGLSPLPAPRPLDVLVAEVAAALGP